MVVLCANGVSERKTKVASESRSRHRLSGESLLSAPCWVGQLINSSDVFMAVLPTVFGEDEAEFGNADLALPHSNHNWVQLNWLLDGEASLHAVSAPDAW